MNRFLSNVTLVAALTISGSALAWDDQGHMMVAAVAYKHLNEATKLRVAAILTHNKYPTNGQNDAAAADKALATFVMAATSPDAIKKDPTNYRNDGEKPTSPDADRNTGFNDVLMHKYWHYIDIPFHPNGDSTPLVQPPTINARERITVCRQTLASTASDEVKAFDLVWLLHLVGDVHQPLHATSRFTRALPHGDNGGNLIKLSSSGESELHAFWDDVLGKNESVAQAIAAANALPPIDDAQATNLDVSVWVAESFQDAKDKVYVSPVGNGAGPYTLTAKYKADAKALAKERVALAGRRLANVLNAELK